MNKKKILIFGAGINQVSLIQACNDLGYESVVIDPSADPPGKKIATYYFVVAPDDYDLTKEIAIKMNVSGIVTSQMENPLKIMARLAKEMGYIFNSPETIERSTNKFLMKQAFLKHNIPCAKGILFNCKEDLTESSLSSLTYPLIIKPADAYSSRGVYKADCFSELLLHVDETISFSKIKQFLVEEFIEGKEYSIESVTFKGKTTVIQYTDKIITPFPNVVEMGHIQPAELNIFEKEQISKVVIKTISALGIDNTVTHTELKISPEGPVIIEIGARMGGDFISSYLTKASCGADLDRASVQICLGGEPDLSYGEHKHTFVKYIQLPPGKTIQKINDLSFLQKNEDIVFYYLYVKEGDKVLPVKHSGNRSAVFIVTAGSRQELMVKAENYSDLLINSIKTN